jgi:hypothetical protein
VSKKNMPFAELVRALRQYHALWPHNFASTATPVQLAEYMANASCCWNECIAPLVAMEWDRQVTLHHIGENLRKPVSEQGEGGIKLRLFNRESEK